MTDEERIQSIKASMGCARGIPWLVLTICALIVKDPRTAGKGGLIAYAVILVLSVVYEGYNAFASAYNGFKKGSKLFLVETIVLLALAIWIFVLLFSK